MLVGATTENPSFEVVARLLSRCRLVRLERLSSDALELVLRRALEVPGPRGLGGVGLVLEDALLRRLAADADGDARAALGTLELASRLATEQASGGGPPIIDEGILTEALQRPWLRYGREEHFDQISALQKSVRNSDPDAAFYWLARMLDAGEDPKYVARRLIRMASEDVGLAEPRALEMAVAGLEAVHAIGLPEGALALPQVAVYLASVPKSNAVDSAYSAALQAVEETRSLPVPMQLRNAVTSHMRAAGYGSGYEYAHDAPDGVTPMECLPEALSGRRFYEPGEAGLEARIAERLRKVRQRRDDLKS